MVDAITRSVTWTLPLAKMHPHLPFKDRYNDLHYYLESGGGANDGLNRHTGSSLLATKTSFPDDTVEYDANNNGHLS